MKPKNFPGRRVQRQIDADIRNSEEPNRKYNDDEAKRIANAQNKRTKIYRSVR